MRKLLSVLAVMLLCVGVADAAELTVGGAINKAGRQRMLTQRVIKAYAQLGLDVLPEASKRHLDQSVELFDAQLKELKTFAPNAKVRRSVARMEQLWKPFKAVAMGPVSRDGAARLLAQEEELVRAADAVTSQLQAYAGIPVGKLVNDSGKERMLSQRLAKLYMLKAWGIDNARLRSEMTATRSEFESKLSALQAAPQNTYSVNRELEAVALQWTWFQSAIETEGEYGSYPLVVADASESMLASIETLTGLYEELVKR